MHKVVKFEKDGVVRILRVEDVSPYKNDPSCLIDPVFPRGIPPHLWKRDKNMLSGQNPVPIRESRYMIPLVISIVINLILLARMIF